ARHRQPPAGPAGGPHAGGGTADRAAAPEPLVRLLGQRIGRPDADAGPLLEVICRRYYREHGLAGLRCEPIGGRPFVTGGYELNGPPERRGGGGAALGGPPRAAAAVAG